MLCKERGRKRKLENTVYILQNVGKVISASLQGETSSPQEGVMGEKSDGEKVQGASERYPKPLKGGKA